MFFDEYQALTEKTMNKSLTLDQKISYCCMGLAGESGEAIDVVKKHQFHGHDIDLIKLKEELGDALWYVSRLAASFGISLEDIAEFNINKLKKRYPDGFSEEASRNRVV